MRDLLIFTSTAQSGKLYDPEVEEVDIPRNVPKDVIVDRQLPDPLKDAVEKLHDIYSMTQVVNVEEFDAVYGNRQTDFVLYNRIDQQAQLQQLRADKTVEKILENTILNGTPVLALLPLVPGTTFEGVDERYEEQRHKHGMNLISVGVQVLDTSEIMHVNKVDYQTLVEHMTNCLQGHRLE